jgi:raffinose/stachyose/melibiose transport system substrate-binding protein
MRSSRALAAIALAAATATAAAACSGGSSSSSSSSSSTPVTSTSASTSTSSSPAAQAVTLTWWNNATSGTLLSVWQSVIKSFEASHPGVTIQNVPIQNEQFTTKIPLALQSNNPPDIYQQWGSGAMATQIKSGKLENITSLTSSWIGGLGSAAKGWSVNGQWYGVPYDYHVVGFWYRKDLFAKAGITAPPTTIAQLESDDAKLKAAGITPMALGSKDRWPDAFWWEYFAVRECPTSVIQQAMASVSLSNSCFTKANTDLTSFMATNPFQSGFNGTPAQQGAGSSAGMVANGKAAMELMGDWDPGVMSGLVSASQTKSLYNDLGWFPFPAVTGGQGDPKVILGGGDGFTCTTGAAEPACEEFLQYLTTPAVQKMIMGAGVGLPVNPAAASALPVAAEVQAQSANQNAPYIAVYFDQALPTQPGQNLDNAVANFFAGTGSVTSIPTSVSGAP